jgi:hypothetical protein
MLVMFERCNGALVSVNTDYITTVYPTGKTGRLWDFGRKKDDGPTTMLVVHEGRYCSYIEVKGDYMATVHTLNYMS